MLASAVFLMLQGQGSAKPAYDDPWKGFAEAACAKIVKRRPDLRSFWDQPLPNGTRTSDRLTEEEEEVRWVRAVASFEFATEARKKGQIDHALGVLRGGMVDLGRGAWLYDEYLAILMRAERWIELRDVLGANLDGPQGNGQPEMLGVALFESGSDASDLTAYVRRRFAEGIPAEEFERLYAQKGGRAVLRQLVWSLYAVDGRSHNHAWAVDRALALDPTGPISVRMKVNLLTGARYSNVPKPTPQEISLAGRLLEAALARLKPEDAWYRSLMQSYSQVDPKAAQRFERRRKD